MASVSDIAPIVDALTKAFGGFLAAGSSKKADQATDEQILTSQLLRQILTRQAQQEVPFRADVFNLLRKRGQQQAAPITPTQAPAFDPFAGGRNPRLQSGSASNRFPDLLAALRGGSGRRGGR